VFEGTDDMEFVYHDNKTDSVPSGLNHQTQSKSVLTDLKVIVAIPCFNTEHSIGQLVKRAKTYASEVIVVDDGSQDKTSEIAAASGARVIKHHINRGKGAAMKTAAKHADCDILVFIDGDGQHNPEEIPMLLEPIIQGKADFVIGSRNLPKSKLTSNTIFRKIANKGASCAISFVITVVQPLANFSQHPHFFLKNQGLKSIPITQNLEYRVLNGSFKWITDCTSGFTAMKFDNWNKLNLNSNGYQIETEIIFEQARNGFIIAETPISCIGNNKLSKLSVIKDGLRTGMLLFTKLKDYSKENKKATL